MVRSRWYGLRVPRTLRVTQRRAPLHPNTFVDQHKLAGVGCLFVVGVKLLWLNDDRAMTAVKRLWTGS